MSKYTPILGTLGYVLSSDGQKVLMVHRNARKDDDHLGKWNGLGGKMLASEDLVTCMKREIMEEAGINCTKMQLRGTVNWTGFGSKGEDWLGVIFLIEAFEGTPYTSNPEGDLHWIELTSLHQLPMWEGDRYFLDLIFDKNPKPFHGYMPYQDGKPTSWSFSRI